MRILYVFRSFRARSLQRQCMFEASTRLQLKKSRGQTLPVNAYNLDFNSSIRSNMSNFNAPSAPVKIEEEDPNAGIELLESHEDTSNNATEGKNFSFGIFHDFFPLELFFRRCRC